MKTYGRIIKPGIAAKAIDLINNSGKIAIFARLAIEHKQKSY
jgi:hypothetical protein